jgi:hypothetical protein
MHTVKLYGYSKSLSEDEKGLVLKELGQASMGETVLLEEADVVCCPHCESRLFVRNGKRGTEQKYKCKACCKVNCIIIHWILNDYSTDY